VRFNEEMFVRTHQWLFLAIVLAAFGAIVYLGTGPA
jgi:hypothetical protein